LSVLYLVRHGQAGTREDYDSLSPLGRRQARLLGEYFAAQHIRFDAAFSGSLARQCATAEEAGLGIDITVDPGWDEFDLSDVYTGMAPHLVTHDEDFRRQYDEMQRAMVASQGAHDHPVHRRWNHCDREVVRAWIEERYEYSGESWRAFNERVHTALLRRTAAAHEGNTIVFTSATPIGICAARTLEIEDVRAMWLTGVLMNTSFSMFRLRGAEVRLFSFNGTAHLNDDSLRTFR
jgi:broad specificity phosphatase PhoE